MVTKKLTTHPLGEIAQGLTSIPDTFAITNDSLIGRADLLALTVGIGAVDGPVYDSSMLAGQISVAKYPTAYRQAINNQNKSGDR